MAYVRIRAALAITLLSASAHHALACTMLPEPPSVPAQERFNYPWSTADSPIHLPANASGVVYLTRETKHAADFTITEAVTRHRLPVKLTVLQALKRAKTDRPDPPDWSDGVTGLRVGPSAGFQPGTAYEIAAAGASIHLVIDDAKVDLVTQKVQLSKVGPPNREYFFSESGCVMIRSAGTAVYQATTQLIPRALQPYLARIYGVDHSPITPGNPMLEQRPFVRYYLGALQVGPAGPLRVDGLHTVGATDDLQPPPKRRRMAHYAFFEVDDAWYETNVLDLTPAPEAIERNDSLDFLREALRSKDMMTMRTQLDATPVRQTSLSPAFQRRMSTVRLNDIEMDAPWRKVTETLADWRYQRRHRALIQVLVHLTRHQDAAIRTSALGAIGRVMQAAEADPLATRNAVKALQRTRGDPASTVRQAATDALAIIAAGPAPN